MVKVSNKKNKKQTEKSRKTKIKKPNPQNMTNSNSRHKKKHSNSNSVKSESGMAFKNIDLEKTNEEILNVKKKKLNDAFKNVDREEVLFAEVDFSDHEDDVKGIKFGKSKFNKKSKVHTNQVISYENIVEKSNEIKSDQKSIDNLILNPKSTKNKNQKNARKRKVDNSEVNNNKKQTIETKANKNISLGVEKLNKDIRDSEKKVSKLNNGTLSDVLQKSKDTEISPEKFANQDSNNLPSKPGANGSKNKAKKKKKQNNVITESNDNEETQTSSKSIESNVTNIVKKVDPKIIAKKAKLEKILNRNKIVVREKSIQLRKTMMERLKAAQFRFLNEKLYKISGSEAKQLFEDKPDAFQEYHEGFRQQVKKWPINPLNVIIKRIKSMPKSHIIADMGCGEAALSRSVPHTVHSFDLVASAPGVVACDMARTPLAKDSVDVVVYCLALMGTDLTKFLIEANRVLKMGGQLLIAEVESRFDSVDTFIEQVEKLGFQYKDSDNGHNVFVFLRFVKGRKPKGKLPELSLKPCLYKKR